MFWGWLSKMLKEWFLRLTLCSVRITLILLRAMWRYGWSFVIETRMELWIGKTTSILSREPINDIGIFLDFLHYLSALTHLISHYQTLFIIISCFLEAWSFMISSTGFEVAHGIFLIYWCYFFERKGQWSSFFTWALFSVFFCNDFFLFDFVFFQLCIYGSVSDLVDTFLKMGWNGLELGLFM